MMPFDYFPEVKQEEEPQYTIIAIEELAKMMKENCIESEYDGSVSASRLNQCREYASDTLDVAKALHDFGITTKYRIKGGHIIFKGYPGKRLFWKGTRYSLKNAKVVHFAKGTRGFGRRLKVGPALTILLIGGTLTVDVIRGAIPKEEYAKLMISETAKAGVTAAITAAVASALTASVGVAVAPIAATVAIGIAVGLGLDYLDRKFELTGRAAAAIGNAWRRTNDSLVRWLYYWERLLISEFSRSIMMSR